MLLQGEFFSRIDSQDFNGRWLIQRKLLEGTPRPIFLMVI
jgi:hypothetical protein